MSVFTEPTNKSAPISNSLLAYAWQLKKDGRCEETITTIVKRLTLLNKYTDINDPEQTKAALSNLQWKNSTKRAATFALNGYYRYLNKTWKKPDYTLAEQNPFIPTEEEIDLLIAAAHPKLAALLQLLKETGMRIGEACNLKWIDLDFQRKTVNITAEKGSNGRTLPLTDKALSMLGQLSHNHTKVFNATKHTQRVRFELLRNRVATKLQNPRLKEIHFHTLRHWKGTMLMHKYHDAWTVKTILGHKSIRSTECYIHLEKQIWLTNSGEYTHATAKTVEEICKLIDEGYERIDELDGIKIYRRRK